MTIDDQKYNTGPKFFFRQIFKKWTLLVRLYLFCPLIYTLFILKTDNKTDKNGQIVNFFARGKILTKCKIPYS